MSHQILLAKNTEAINIEDFKEEDWLSVTKGKDRFNNYLLLKDGERTHVCYSDDLDIQGMIQYFKNKAKEEYLKMKTMKGFTDKYTELDYENLILLTSLMPTYFLEKNNLIKTSDIKKEEQLQFLINFTKTENKGDKIRVFDVY